MGSGKSKRTPKTSLRSRRAARRRGRLTAVELVLLGGGMYASPKTFPTPRRSSGADAS